MMRKGDDAYYLGCKQGFTLIEMMIAVAIIGILAAIALPSYSYFVEKADLAHARTGLVTINQILVREKIKGNLTGAIIQNNTDIALGGVDVGVREKYDIVVRCGSVLIQVLAQAIIRCPLTSCLQCPMI
jgi:type IV pilus assembly protein PilE